MSSEYPLHVSFSPNGTSFKRTFEQFGYDSSPPMSSAIQASGSGSATHNAPAGSSSNTSGNERNKRARSTSSSSVSNSSADSSRSSEYSTARSSTSLSESSTTNDHNLSLDQNRRSPTYQLASIASTTSTLTSPSPALPGTEPQDEVMSDGSGFALEIPRPTPVPEVASSTTTHDTISSSIERFNEFDSHIAALRRSHSRTPSWLPAPSPVLSPLESSNHTTEAFDSWDWTHFGASPGQSQTSGEDRRRRYSTDATTSIASAGTYAAVSRQGDSLSFQTSDVLSRPGYTASSSNASNSTSSSATPPHPSYRTSSSASSSARTATFSRESDQFTSGFTGSVASIPSVLQPGRNNTDALSGLDGRQDVHQGSGSSSSNLSWAAFASSRPSSPAAPSPDVVTRPGFLDSVFEPVPGTRAYAARRSAHSDTDWRSTSSARTTSASTSTSSSAFDDSISRFDIANEERHQDTSNTFEDNNPPPSGSLQELTARARAAIERSRNSSMTTLASTSTSSSAFDDSISRFYVANEERHQGTSNTFDDNNPPPSGSLQEFTTRTRAAIERSRNSIRPLSEAFDTFAREQTAEDSNEPELSFDRFLTDFDGEDTIDLFDERRRRVMGRNRYNIAGEDDDDDTSHPDSVRDIIQGLHNARGLLERGVETARSLSGTPPRPEPNPPPPPRYRLHSRLYTSATTVSSNSLVSESAAEHRRTNAMAQLRSQVFNSRPNSDVSPRDGPGYPSLTAAARLRRLIATQADSSSNASRPPVSSRPSDPPSRPFGFSSSVPPPLPRGGLNERERVRFAEILSEHRHPQARIGNNRSPSRDHNHISSEDSPDNIFDPVFAEVADFRSSAEEDAQPPYVYRSPTPPLHTLRAARSRSPPHISSERAQVSTSDTSARSHPFSNVDLDMFPPGIYRDSLRRSIQASQGRSNPRVPVPEPTLSSSTTFSFGNSDEDNDSDDMDSYFGVLVRSVCKSHVVRI
ncbi:uncharacterized protein EDB91DRAFT_795203 [Suillus paluster]|uniref:uncharacterized protein n=1 Tax=Suillus paluster TaxID=48578 RepID=UPI001B87A3AD|nr:uncharacterized protein EDB91DRAFT_795203 [Suillus paluster]KAG1730120.1 hypothetical protein EDB91DRAFT_795203 [Suillus paluster]